MSRKKILNNALEISAAEGIPNPRIGELWDCEGRVSFIAGNSLSKHNRIWVMDWNTGECGDALLNWLTLRNDRFSLSENDVVNRFSQWARNRNTDAMWFLAYWFEGNNHPKSIWYYIAALRADPKKFEWAYDRIVSDAYTASCCWGIPTPDLKFLRKIPEMRKPVALCGKWKLAVEMAEAAIHIPSHTSNKKQNEQSKRFLALKNVIVIKENNNKLHFPKNLNEL